MNHYHEGRLHRRGVYGYSSSYSRICSWNLRHFLRRVLPQRVKARLPPTTLHLHHFHHLRLAQHLIPCTNVDASQAIHQDSANLHSQATAMPTKSEDRGEEPPTDINPYEVLGLQPDATADDIKTAYRKQALKHHPGTPHLGVLSQSLISTSKKSHQTNPASPTPDKAPPSSKETAHIKFQAIAFAYAILSSPARRRRYDSTGSTSESLLDDDDFDWTSFYREQFANVITGSTLDKFKEDYIASGEERRDVLAAYTKGKGNMNAVYRSVMLSNPLDDEERYRGIIDGAIAEGDVEVYKAYTEEPAKKKEGRMEMARREGKEAREYAKKLGVEEKLFGDGKGRENGKKGGDEGLPALIQQRQKGRAEDFFEKLEAKYAGGGGKGKKGKKRASEADEEPPEEAFQRTAERAEKKSKRRRKDVKDGGEGQPGSNGTRKSKRVEK